MGYKEKKRKKGRRVYAHNGKRQVMLSETLESLGKRLFFFRPPSLFITRLVDFIDMIEA